MITIRQEQLDTLSQDVIRRFEKRLSHDLEALFPDQMAAMGTRSPGENEPVLTMVRRNLEHARGYAIERTSDLAVFVGLVVADLKLSEPGKPRYLDWTREFFEVPDADGESKVALVEHEIGRLAQRDPRAADLAALLAKLRTSY